MNHPICYADRKAASYAAAEQLYCALSLGLEQQDRASLLVSGGTSPGAVFETLAMRELAWEKICVAPVDERWVPPDDPRSNEALIRTRLLTGSAKAARFFPLKTDAPSPAQAADERSETLKPLLRAPLVILLGMGEDGHTASWFPGLKNLETLMDPDNPANIMHIDATACPGAGDCPQRLTFTASALSTAKQATLLIFGDAKLRVYKAACKPAAPPSPIGRARELLGARLKVIWAP